MKKKSIALLLSLALSFVNVAGVSAAGNVTSEENAAAEENVIIEENVTTKENISTEENVTTKENISTEENITMEENVITEKDASSSDITTKERVTAEKEASSPIYSFYGDAGANDEVYGEVGKEITLISAVYEIDGDHYQVVTDAQEREDFSFKWEKVTYDASTRKQIKCEDLHVTTMKYTKIVEESDLEYLNNQIVKYRCTLYVNEVETSDVEISIYDGSGIFMLEGKSCTYKGKPLTLTPKLYNYANKPLEPNRKGYSYKWYRTANGQRKGEVLSTDFSYQLEQVTKTDYYNKANKNATFRCEMFIDGERVRFCDFKIKCPGHKYETSITKATTTKDGEIVEQCSICNTKKSTNISYPKTIALNNNSFTYNKKPQKPSVTITGSDKKKISSSNYKVAYSSGRKNVGKYKVKVTFKGNYTGTITKTFHIVPKGTSFTKVTASKKGLTAKWSKQPDQATGYQVQYSTDKNFKSNTKLATIKKNSTVSKKLSNLKAGKKYYVRIRTYKTIKVDGKSAKLYSGWSKSKGITTLK